jgi:haloacetate dehalogenase
MGSRHAGLKPFAPEALAEYRRCFRDPAAIHASCEDYRAAESIDLEHDEADIDRKVTAPLLVLWGKHGTIARCFQPLADWAERAESVRGRDLDCGHYIPEEAPAELVTELIGFFS